jgi:hypothetical protein
VDLHALGYRSRLFLVLVLVLVLVLGHVNVLEKMSFFKTRAKKNEDEYEDEVQQKVAISKRI